MEQARQLVLAKVEVLVALLLPVAAPAAVDAAGVQRIVGVGVGLFLPVDGVGQGRPGVAVQPAKAGGEQVLPLLGGQRQPLAPDFREQVDAPCPLLFHHGGLLQLFGAKGAQRFQHRLVRGLLGAAEGHKGFVPPQHLGAGKGAGRLGGKVVEHRELQHPLAQVLAHGGLPHAGLHKACLEGLELLQGVLGGGGANAVEQLVDIDIGHRGGDGRELPPADLGPPGEIAPQLPDV